jgi:subtilisin-like proprotein convertase family protein
VTNNKATTLQGGGLYNSGSATLTNVTVSDNLTPGSTVGGLFNNNPGSVTMKNVTLSNNSQPGINNNSGTVTLVNTIVAQNCLGPITSNGHNLESGTTCNLHATGDITNTNPLLGALQNNGGFTPSRAISGAGPEIDRGDDGQCPATDQRGLARPQGDHCDIGSLESVTFNNNSSTNIIDNGCTTSTINVNTSPYIGKLTAGVNLDFSPRGYLSITLTSPHDTQVTLLAFTLGSAHNLNTTFDDSASSVVPDTDQSSTPPDYRYFYKPYTTLAQVNNSNAHGLWVLKICNLSGNTGTLNSWQISIPSIITSIPTYLPLTRR